MAVIMGLGPFFYILLGFRVIHMPQVEISGLPFPRLGLQQGSRKSDMGPCFGFGWPKRTYHLRHLPVDAKLLMSTPHLPEDPKFLYREY